MNPKKLFICSIGLKPEHLTLETVKALKSSQAVFSHSLRGGSAEALLRGFCGDFRPLIEISPEKILRTLVKAFKTRDILAFLTYGNPLFLNTTADLLRAELPRAGVEVEVLPAVSSFDAMLNMPGLGEFPAAGVRLVHAGLSGGEIELYPQMGTLIFMADKLNKAERKEHAGAKAKFIARVVAAYPPEHEFMVVNAPFMEDRAGRVIKFPVKDFALAFGALDRNSTIFIPKVP